jgi:hypothetical protein
MAHARPDDLSSNPLLRKLQTARRLGAKNVAGMVVGRVRELFRSEAALVVFSMREPQLKEVLPVSDGVDIQLVSDDPARLLASGRLTADTPPRFRDELANFSRPGARVHYALVDGRLAAWGFSLLPAGKWPLTETGTVLDTGSAGTCLVSFETLPDYRGRRLHPAIIYQSARERFADGAEIAYAWCLEGNTAAYKNIVRTGYVPFETHRWVRVLRMGRPEIRPIA